MTGRGSRRGNAWLAGGLVTVVLGMVGLSFASVPLYRLFCQVTGYGGTVRIGTQAGPGAETTMITVHFDANTDAGLPWQFAPDRPSVRLPLGAEQLATYRARNVAAEPVVGVARYNVTPDTAGRYFHKTACFCLSAQTLAAGQEMHFPLTFWVDPAIATDPETAGIHTITLSYTFFRSAEEATRPGLVAYGPHVGPLIR